MNSQTNLIFIILFCSLTKAFGAIRLRKIQPEQGFSFEGGSLSASAKIISDIELKRVRFILKDASNNVINSSDASLGARKTYTAELQVPNVSGTYSIQYKAIDVNNVQKNILRTIQVTAGTENVGEVAAIVRQRIEDLVDNNRTLKPKFVRLGFHDCIGKDGGCDGCVDLSNDDNYGLEIPIDALRPIVQEFEGQGGITRADIWAMAAMIGADSSQSQVEGTPYDFAHYGRVNCEDSHDQCFDADNNEVACDDTHGPHRVLPSPNFNTTGLLHFFSSEFNFNARQTAALMGAHSIGTAKREHSGFNGPDGWVNNNVVLSNGYYDLLIGGSSRLGDTYESVINDFEKAFHAPLWTQEFIDNEDIDGIENRIQWFHQKNVANAERSMMLNSDIALVRDLKDHMNEETGEVSTCEFRNRRDPTNRCPHAEATWEIMIEFKFDNALWLEEFHDVFMDVLHHGHVRSSDNCSSANPCLLSLEG